MEWTEHVLSTARLFVCFQVHTLSQEDVDAYLSQAVCLRLKSPAELQQIKVSERKHTIDAETVHSF